MLLSQKKTVARGDDSFFPEAFQLIYSERLNIIPLAWCLPILTL